MNTPRPLQFVFAVLVTITAGLPVATAQTTAPAGPGGRGGRGGRGGFAPIQWPQGPEPRVHDPVMIKEGGWYYVFQTRGLLNVMRSRDLQSWDRVSWKVGDQDVA